MNKKHDPEKFQISLKILLKNNRDEYLILKSSPGPYFKEKFDFPGGRINTNEVNVDFHKLIDREINEETGKIKYKLRPDPVSVSNYKFPNKKTIFYILFEAEYINGKITISDEHTEFRWQKLKSSNIKKLFHPSLIKLLRNYFKWNKNFTPTNLKI